MDLIFVSMENWDDIWRRNQFVCAELARRFPDDKILFVGLARDISNQIRRGKLRDLGPDDTRTVPDYPQITVTRPVKLLPNSFAIGRRVNDLIARRHIQKEAKKLALRSPILWLNPHSAVHLVGQLDESAAIYDITDDWTSLTQSLTTRELTIQQDAAMCRAVDAVIVCSKRLYELKKGLAQNLHLIPNGVDSEHYRFVMQGAEPLPEETTRWERPTFGYTGTIHPDRVDVSLIEQMAKAMQKGTIALVGPSHLLEQDRARLEATGRVCLTGAVSYARIPQYMRAFDVCITPHVVTEFTESLNPIKLWEYLASGKPIVSTPVAGFRDYPRFVRLAEGAKAFLAEAQLALTEDPGAASLRQQEAQQHSWKQRTNHILEVFAAAEAAHIRRS